jgi:hypothetical protein
MCRNKQAGTNTQAVAATLTTPAVATQLWAAVTAAPDKAGTRVTSLACMFVCLEQGQVAGVVLLSLATCSAISKQQDRFLLLSPSGLCAYREV